MQIPNKKYSLGYEFKYIKNNCKEIIKIIIVEIKDHVFLSADASCNMFPF